MKNRKLKLYPFICMAGVLFLNGCNSSQPLEEKEVQRDVVESSEITPRQEKLQKQQALAESVVSQPHPASMGRVQGEMVLAKVSMPASAFYPSDRRDDRMLQSVPGFQQESYNALRENRFIATSNSPLSTFSIDVDTASYSNIRRLVNGGQLPPVGAVRVEEMLNYFAYDYPEPDKDPLGITTEIGPCPWQPENKLVRIGVKAKDIEPGLLPPSNLVFLIDVSGSMNQSNKLPLLKNSMLMLADQLTEKDRLSIVVYAGSDRIVLQPTTGNKTSEIQNAIKTLRSGGSTHGSSGILTAYKLARQSFIPQGNNRIILASDGDFNVGTTTRGELERLIAKERESGVYLTVLGFGMGNYHDDSMEILADRGNGNYSYIDSLLEAKKVLIKERASTLFTLAKDVKLQVEFNPAKVSAYRLIGYENRNLTDEDFNDDHKDAGEIGVGHTVTALYEIMPTGVANIPSVDSLKYQTLPLSPLNSSELLTVKLRYKPAQSGTSRLVSKAVVDADLSLVKTSKDYRFSAAVAGYGMLLGHSEFAGNITYPLLIQLAQSGKGFDAEGYRAEFIRLLEMSELLSRSSG